MKSWEGELFPLVIIVPRLIFFVGARHALKDSMRLIPFEIETIF